MSNYFSYFPTFLQDLKQDGVTREVTNIFKRFKIRSNIKDNLNVYYDYEVQAGDRPDIIAEKYYGDGAYAWVVLHFNDIIDPVFDWPLFNYDFDEYIKGKYGSISIAQSQVYEYRKILTQKQTKGDGTIIDERYVAVDEETYSSLGEVDRKLITAWDHEVEQNDAKRTIKILDKRYLNQIKGEVEDILRNGV